MTQQDITLHLSVTALVEALHQILMRPSNLLGGNPLCQIVAKAVTDAAPRIASVVNGITTEFVASDEFARRIRQVYRDALLGEASRMGVNAARAAVNAKEPQ